MFEQHQNADPQQNNTAPHPQALSQSQVPVGAHIASANAVPSTIPGGMAKAKDASSLKFAEHSDFNISMLILWLVAAFAILATVYFWWNEKNLEGVLAEKNTEKNAVVMEVNSPSNIAIEKEAIDFKASVAALSAAYKTRYPVSTFLPDFYKKVNKDVVIDNLSITVNGSISISGTTTSYRSVAEQVLSFQTFTSLSGVDLASTAVSNSDGNQMVSFTITANLVNPDKLAASATPAPSALSGSTAASTTTTGGAQ